MEVNLIVRGRTRERNSICGSFTPATSAACTLDIVGRCRRYVPKQNDFKLSDIYS
jgi:hypothetical protein